jgi:hypothetical protein
LTERLAVTLRTTKERALEMAWMVVHRVLTMFESHYSGLDLEKLSGGWAPDYDDDEYKFEADSADFANAMTEVAMKDLGLLKKGKGDDGTSS